MEHTLRGDTRAVLARFVRWHWKRPFQVAGIGALAFGLTGFAFTRPHHGKASAPFKQVASAGEVRSLEEKDVAAPFTGTLAALTVREGQPVQKGQVLGKMDTSTIVQELSAARAQEAAALRDYSQTKTQEAAEERELESALSAARAQLGQARQSVTVTQPGQPAQPTEDSDGQPADTQPRTQVVTQYDPQLAAAANARIAAITQQLQERRQAWAPALSQAASAASKARAQVKRLAAVLAMAERTSPMSGIVTAVYAHPGSPVTAGQALVRIDNPDKFRVVTFVDDKIRMAVQPGMRVALDGVPGVEGGNLEKIVPGEDKELFHYWLWVKPDDPAKVHPGQKLDVLVPRSTVREAEAAL